MRGLSAERHYRNLFFVGRQLPKGSVAGFDDAKAQRNETSFRGLVVQAVGAFEVFVQSWCGHQFLLLEQKLDSKSITLSDSLRDNFLAKAGNVLQFKSAGTYKGQRFNFATLEKSLPTVLLRSDPMRFDAAVLSTRLGACDSEKLNELCDFFGVEGVFRKELGAHLSTKTWREGTASPTAIANLLREELDNLISIRNQLAHGARPSLTIDSVIDGTKLLVALATFMDA